MKSHDKLAAKARSLGIGNYERHILLCIGPDCCSPQEGAATWDHLKSRLKELGPNCSAFRTKVGCLRVCEQGPIAVVYPEGTWYRNVSPEACEEIINSHLQEGKIVADHAFAANPLSVPQADQCNTEGTPALRRKRQ